MTRKKLPLVLVAGLSLTAAEQCRLCTPGSSDATPQARNRAECQVLSNGLDGLEEGSDECRGLKLQAFQIGCCDADTVPQVCSLCPNGGPFLTGIEIPSTSGGPDLKCRDLPNEASFLDFLVNKADCSDTFLQRSSAWCGCSDSSIQCSLCPDGSEPDKSKEENVLYGWNCNVFDYIHSLLNEAECNLAAEILEFDATAFCCPGVKEAPGVCSFCPDGSVVDPEKIVSSGYGPLKCGDIEKSLSFIPTEKACTFTRSRFNTDLCCASSGGSNSSSKPVLCFMLVNVLAAGIALAFV